MRWAGIEVAEQRAEYRQKSFAVGNLPAHTLAPCEIARRCVHNCSSRSCKMGGLEASQPELPHPPERLYILSRSKEEMTKCSANSYAFYKTKTAS